MDTQILLLVIMPTVTKNTPPFGLYFWIASTGENMVTSNGDDLVFNPG